MKHLKECINLINDLKTNLRVVNIRELYNKESLDFTFAGTLSKLCVVPKDFEKEGSDTLFYAFINQKKTTNFVSTPTLDVAQRWLREIKNIHIEISPNSDISAYIYNILLPGDKFWLGSPISYITYEEAQEAGIKKALEIILDKEK